MTNRLAHESSPYLRQHAENPIDWYPWGEAALAKARDEDKPIFLSIGYSACHWCHVMAHESFEDPRVAAMLNEHFVSIKVDREERPDLDRIYMAAVQALTGNGGWPMSVFTTPDGGPFYGGTYFPPTSRHGLPAFGDVLDAVRDAWDQRRDEIEQGAGRVVKAIRSSASIPGKNVDETAPSLQTLKSAVEALSSAYEHQHGGWGRGPKFPQPMVTEFLLRYHHLTGDEHALEMVTHTLDAMARGGMYDQIGGGFHRYSVDDRWLVPHFEKMLYDNAQLARVYLHAWQVTGKPFYRTIVEETLDYVIREMTHPAGGFHSTQDADSEGGEGAFFVWTPHEILQVLGEGADSFMEAYGVTDRGNFEGRNILEYVGELDRRPDHERNRRKLLAARSQRVAPARDDKVLVSWNGLMLAVLAEAARVLNRDDYRQVAERNADMVLRELRQANGRLFHSWKDGEARLNGYLEDHTNLIEGLLELYQVGFGTHWFLAARELAETMIARFGDGEGGFYDTSDDHEKLITRPRELQDNAAPSGNAMAATVFLKLAGLTHNLRYAEMAHQTLARVRPLIAQYPLGFGQWLQAASYAISEPKEVAIIGDLESVDTRALLDIARDGYRPFQVVALGAPKEQAPIVPLLQDRGKVANKATAYVCRSMSCRAPVTRPDELHQQLNVAQ